MDKIEYDVDLNFLKPKEVPAPVKPEPSVPSQPSQPTPYNPPQNNTVNSVPAINRNLKPNVNTVNNAVKPQTGLKENNITKAESMKENRDLSNNVVNSTAPKVVNSTSVIQDRNVMPVMPDRKLKPKQDNDVNKPAGISGRIPGGGQGEAAQTAAEILRLNQLLNTKQEEYGAYQQDKDRMVAEHKARRARLEADQKAIDEIQNVKDKHLRETADIMRQKRKIEDELRELEREREAKHQEGIKRYVDTFLSPPVLKHGGLLCIAF